MWHNEYDNSSDDDYDNNSDDDRYYGNKMYDEENHYHKPMSKNAYRRDYYEDTGSQIFRKHVLKWKIEDILRPQNQQLPLLPKALGPSDTNHYYQNFLPLILEETRAILAQGLDAENKNKTKSFAVSVIGLKAVGRNHHNPVNLELKGTFPKNTDKGRACIALKLTFSSVDDRKSSILCLADIREQNKIFAKIIYLNDSGDSYDCFMHAFMKRNPTAFNKGNKWTACVLGSVLSQMRMYEACHAPKPTFIREVIAGQLQPSAQKAIRIFPEFNASHQQAVQAFSELNSNNQKTIITFYSLNLLAKISILKFFSLNVSKKKKVQDFLLLNVLERTFVSTFYLLNPSEQKAVGAFSVLNFSSQRTVKNFSSFNSLERAAVNTFHAQPVPNKEAIQRFSSLNTSEEEAVRKFSLLNVLEWETVSTFYKLNALEQETIRHFCTLNASLQQVLKDSSLFFSSIWQFFTGNSWYESTLKPLRAVLGSVEAQFKVSAQHAVRIVNQLNVSTNQEVL